MEKKYQENIPKLKKQNWSVLNSICWNFEQNLLFLKKFYVNFLNLQDFFKFLDKSCIKLCKILHRTYQNFKSIFLSPRNSPVASCDIICTQNNNINYSDINTFVKAESSFTWIFRCFKFWWWFFISIGAGHVVVRHFIHFFDQLLFLLILIFFALIFESFLKKSYPRGDG